MDWTENFSVSLTANGLVLVASNATINRVPATGLGFPASITHVAENVYVAQMDANYTATNLWPAPALGGHVFLRMLLRQSLPATVGSGTGGDHGFQWGIGEVEWFWRIWQGGASVFSLEAGTWNGTVGELQIVDAPKNTVLRLEWRLTKSTATTGTATFRAYNNANGSLLGELASSEMTGMTDSGYRQASFGMSGQAGADYNGGSVYWTAIAARVSTDSNAWIGNYPAAGEP